MTRVTNLASNNQLISILLKTQQRLHNSEISLSTEKISQDYKGVALDSRRLLSLETTRIQTQRYIQDNNTMQTRLDIADMATESLREVINNFRQRLIDFRSATPTEQNTADIQEFAFESLRSMQDFLNTQADGQFLFAGSRVDTVPVDLGLDDLDAFQSKYDGVTDIYPTNRTAHLANFSIDQDPKNENALFVDVSNHMTFRQDDDGDNTTSGRSSIEATTDVFANMTAGTRITVTGTSNNNGTYTIDSVSSDGTKIYIKTEMLTDDTLTSSLTAQDVTNGLVAEASTANVDFSIVSGSGTGAGTYTMTFNATTMTITDDGTGGTLTGGLAAGDRIEITGSGSNDGIYTVESITDGDNFTVRLDDPLTTDTSDTSGITVEHPPGSGNTAAFGDLSFDNATGQIADNGAAGTLSASMSVGDTFTISGSVSNDGTYTVASLPNSDTITIERLDATITPSGGSAIALSSIGNMSFDASGGTISARTSGAFDSISVGDTITVANTARGSTDNDGIYTVTAKTGDVITIERAVTITQADETELDIGNTGQITFNRANGTITAATSGAFDGVTAGEIITIANAGENNGTYTVTNVSSDGTTITIDDVFLTDEGTSSGSDTFFDYSVGSQMTFTQNTGVNDGTIEIQPNGGGTALTGTFSSFAVGDTITVTNTAAHNGTYTINAISSDGSTITVDGDLGSDADDTDGANIASTNRNFSYDTGTQLDFDATNNTIQIQDNAALGGNALDGYFKNLRVGQTIEITNTASNNGTYTISAIDADNNTITVNEDIITDETEATDARLQVFAADGTITASNSYYQGDDVAITHRLDKNLDFTFDLNAIHPAFEKAIRAMGMIAQGVFGTEGGLDQNQDRSNDAIWLLNQALQETSSTNANFTDELSGDMIKAQKDLGFQRLRLDRSNQRHNNLLAFLESSIGKIENSDTLTVVTELQNNARVLEASYQALARVQSLSLTNFL